MENINYEKQTQFTWGIQELDKRFWCPDIRELIVLFGFMSSWKTEFSYFVARSNADKWNKILYLSLELPEYDMKLRICRKKAGISKYDFQKKKYSESQKEIMEKTRNDLKLQNNVLIRDVENKWLADVEKAIRTAYDEWCRMFIIDNLDKIRAENKEDENSRYQRITTFLQDFKNNNDACIILIHHAKKADSKGVVYKRAWLWGMRGSQKIMDNATQVFEIYRDLDPDIQDDTERSKVEIIQMKDTFEGANGTKEIYFYKGDYYDYETYKEKKYEA
jgi:RecA-family ATPase